MGHRGGSGEWPPGRRGDYARGRASVARPRKRDTTLWRRLLCCHTGAIVWRRGRACCGFFVSVACSPPWGTAAPPWIRSQIGRIRPSLAARCWQTVVRNRAVSGDFDQATLGDYNGCRNARGILSYPESGTDDVGGTDQLRALVDRAPRRTNTAPSAPHSTNSYAVGSRVYDEGGCAHGSNTLRGGAGKPVSACQRQPAGLSTPRLHQCGLDMARRAKQAHVLIATENDIWQKEGLVRFSDLHRQRRTKREVPSGAATNTQRNNM